MPIELVFLGLILFVLGGEALLRCGVGLATLAKLTPELNPRRELVRVCRY
jgi:hypothetical protein